MFVVGIHVTEHPGKLQQGGHAGSIGIGPREKTASKNAQIVIVGHQHYVSARLGVAGNEAHDIADDTVAGDEPVHPSAAQGAELQGKELVLKPICRASAPFRGGGTASQFRGT